MPLHRMLRNKTRNVGVLREAGKAPSSFRSYRLATLAFSHWLKQHSPDVSELARLDELLADFGYYLYSSNQRRGQRQKFLNTLYGVEFFLPETSRELRYARQAAQG